MLHLLKIEWLKIKNYRTFWIIFVLYLVSIVGANYLVSERLKAYFDRTIKKNPTDAFLQMLIGKPPFSFPEVWQMVGYVSSFLLIIPGLLTIILITNEYNYKTHRQNIIDGLTRQQFIVVKILTAAILSLISTCMVVLTASAFGIADGSNGFSLEGFHYIGYYFLQAMSYIMVALLMSVLFKRGGLAIGVFFAYSMVLEQILVLLMNKYMNYAGRYLPLETTDILTPFPRIDKIINTLTSNTPDYTLFFILALVYMAAYLFIVMRKFETDDL